MTPATTRAPQSAQPAPPRRSLEACSSRLAYRFVVGVDVEGFSKRSALDQVKTQADLSRALETAAAEADLDRSAWHRQVAGDGELAVLPPNTDGLRLIAAYPQALARALAQVNASRPPELRVRVRLAMHHGTLAAGPFGPVGQAPIVVSRLLDSQILRKELLRADEDVALIVSASIYDDVVETRLDGLEPRRFCSVEVKAKSARYGAYIYRGRYHATPR